MVTATTTRRSEVQGPSSIEVLRNQELSQEYQCLDYLVAGDAVTAAIREEMLEWVCKVTTFMKLSEDIPILTATLLDRFSQTKEGRQILDSIPDFRLAAMGCLYLTAKVHEPSVVISSNVMSALSQGLFAPEDVEEMELVILKAMNWHTNPPTALAFVREFLLLLPCSVSASAKEQAFEHCQAQLHRSILDYESFALTEASTIAFFAVLNSLRSLGMDSITLGHVSAIFSYSTHTDYYGHPEKEEALKERLLGVRLQKQRKDIVKKRSKTSRRASQGSFLPSSTSITSSISSSKSWSRSSMSFDESPCGVALGAR